jgi:signal transduction histidine kinase
MTDDEVIAIEARVKRALHKTETALKNLHAILHDVRQEVANDRGMDVTVMSGGDADDKDPPNP